VGTVTTPPRAVRGDMTKAVARICAVDLRREGSSEAPSPRGILRHARCPAAPGSASRLRISLLRLHHIGLCPLLPLKRALFTRLLYLLPPLRTLRRRQPA
jgi:hypothetical protein